MLIKSPVGRFPFSVTGLHFKSRRLVLEGRMGTWPATVEVDPAEVPTLLFKLGPTVFVPVVSVLGLAAVGVAAIARARTRSST